jgi:quercetin dioxygenase-like cupin family protein
MALELIRTSTSTPAPIERFTGGVFSTSIITPRDGSQLVAGLARFTPGGRTNWHSHALGQALYITDGVGLVGSRDGTTLRVRAGDVVWTPPGEEHWHGADPSSFMTHVAMLQGCTEGETNVWLEPVSDADYLSGADQAR